MRLGNAGDVAMTIAITINSAQNPMHINIHSVLFNRGDGKLAPLTYFSYYIYLINCVYSLKCSISQICDKTFTPIKNNVKTPYKISYIGDTWLDLFYYTKFSLFPEGKFSLIR
jgi:hypothetical protein